MQHDAFDEDQPTRKKSPQTKEAQQARKNAEAEQHSRAAYLRGDAEDANPHLQYDGDGYRRFVEEHMHWLFGYRTAMYTAIGFSQVFVHSWFPSSCTPEEAESIRKRYSVRDERGCSAFSFAMRDTAPPWWSMTEVAQSQWGNIHTGGVEQVDAIGLDPGLADRRLTVITIGERKALEGQLRAEAHHYGYRIEHDEIAIRAYMCERKTDCYPATEELLVVAPALAKDKAKKRFAKAWAHATQQFGLW